MGAHLKRDALSPKCSPDVYNNYVCMHNIIVIDLTTVDLFAQMERTMLVDF